MLLLGATATQLREGERLVDVAVRAPAAERLGLGAVGDLSIATPAGAVPLAHLARLEPVMEEPIFWRRSREPLLAVRADVEEGLQGPDVTAAALPRLEALRARLPAGARIVTGGAVEESAKANAALYTLFPLMVGAMLLLLMWQLRHFDRTALVLAPAPLTFPHRSCGTPRRGSGPGRGWSAPARPRRRRSGRGGPPRRRGGSGGG